MTASATIDARALATQHAQRARRKRTTEIIFTLIMPAAFFLLFGANASYRHERVGVGNVTGYVLISMAVYGAMLARPKSPRCWSCGWNEPVAKPRKGNHNSKIAGVTGSAGAQAQR